MHAYKYREVSVDYSLQFVCVRERHLHSFRRTASRRDAPDRKEPSCDKPSILDAEWAVSETYLGIMHLDRSNGDGPFINRAASRCQHSPMERDYPT